MSRSYKRVPGFSDTERYRVKWYYLRLMNRRIRRLDPLNEGEGLSSGNSYRKNVNRYDYRDCNWRYFSLRELKASWYGKAGLYKAIRK